MFNYRYSLALLDVEINTLLWYFCEKFRSKSFKRPSSLQEPRSLELDTNGINQALQYNCRRNYSLKNARINTQEELNLFSFHYLKIPSISLRQTQTMVIQYYSCFHLQSFAAWRNISVKFLENSRAKFDFQSNSIYFDVEFLINGSIGKVFELETFRAKRNFQLCCFYRLQRNFNLKCLRRNILRVLFSPLMD